MNNAIDDSDKDFTIELIGAKHVSNKTSKPLIGEEKLITITIANYGKIY